MIESKERKFEVGDKVEYSSAFLRSIGWMVNVPRGGTVVSTSTSVIVRVRFDFDPDADTEPRAVHFKNLIAKDDVHKEPN